MSHLRICLPCRVKFQTDEPAGCPRCGASSFFTMRVGDIGTAMCLDSAGLNYCDLELIELPAPIGKND